MSAARRQPGFVIAVAGLKAEAQIAARSQHVRSIAGGGGATRLAGLVERAVADGARALLSFGIAGGLSEGLRPADCVIGGEVVHAGKVYRADAAWTACLARQLHPAALHRVAGVDRAVATPAGKRALHSATGAAAVDMESQIVAEAATRHGLPFAIMRVIADPASRGLPPAALAGLLPDGGIDSAACLRSLLRNPAQAPALAVVALDAGRAMRQLLRCVQQLGPGLGFLDRG